MDELLEFIKSLNGINADNIYEYVINFENLIIYKKVHKEKNIAFSNKIDMYHCSIVLNDIFIITTRHYTKRLASIEVLVNDRYICANLLVKHKFNSLTGIINPIQNVVKKESTFGTILGIKTDDLIVTDDKCNIDWLLNLKPIKSAKQ